MKVVLIIKICIVLYLAIMTHWIVLKISRQSKYGKALFKINSLNYKKGIKGKRIYKLKVAPFVENNKIYLPISGVAKSLGFKGITEEESNSFVINIFYKKILINDQENIVVVFKGLHERGYKLRGVSKKIDNELMVSVNTIADIFNLSFKIYENGEILLK